ncbi:MAG TPA: hypothetical protein VG099_02470 [Gemmataceae bacterium]|jgi:hypothetical protein|nr:hypothetical protein [Gemmataceae bacterium]
MDPPNPPAPLSAEAKEAFTVQVLRYLDGACSPEEIRHLKATLAGGVTYRKVFVQVCGLKGNLLEAFAAKRAGMHQRAADPLLASTAAPALRGGSTASSERATGPEQAQEDFALPPQAPSLPGPGDPGAETIIGELSGEDTIHPVPKAPPP